MFYILDTSLKSANSPWAYYSRLDCYYHLPHNQKMMNYFGLRLIMVNFSSKMFTFTMPYQLKM